ncbi:MAG: serine/threonine-protein kinase, partial [Acidobacteriota bacterium]
MPLQGRYEIRDVIGKGGMGVVYRAWDSVIRRDVALKTIRDSPSREALDLFRKECAVLAQVSHPNIIEIFDLGELEAESGAKPYFVMPLMNGQTLEWIIRHQNDRLTVERVVDIVCQTCRGLQAAHEKGLIHRDVKPSNIFVLNDDSVKIIDFGVAHMADTRSTIGHKGTLLYMSPEQLEMKPLTPLSDLFSAATLCYEALTGRRPFERPSQGETVRAILAENATPVSEINAAVNSSVSRVIHKAMAKQPRHRFASARDFADALQKALRNEPLEFLDPSRLKPRVERATRAFEQGDLAFASEIAGELEAEGFLSTEVTALRR